MEILNFLNTHPIEDVKEFGIGIKCEEPYFILKYGDLDCNFNLKMVRECRGIVVRKCPETNTWICVARAMDKFGNWGEEYADTEKIDWSLGVSVQEKVDGSLMKIWWDEGKWHLSTNGTIDAFKAMCGDSSFGEVFKSIVEMHTPYSNFISKLDKDYCYWFEMVHPVYNRIVVKYDEPAIYYLGCRNMQTMEECRECLLEFDWVRVPKTYKFSSLAECIEAAHLMGDDEEGYVVTAYAQKDEGSYLRVKVKGDEYLRLHKIRGNGVLTALRVIKMWKADSLDDFVAYFPEYKEFVGSVMQPIRHLVQVADIAFHSIKGLEERKEFARYAYEYIPPIRAYLFARKDNKVENAEQFFHEAMLARNLLSFIENEIKVKETGVEEGE